MSIGPVQLLVVSFDEPHFTGEIVAELRRLRESDVIRLIDALVVQKDAPATWLRCSGVTCRSRRPRAWEPRWGP